MQKIYPKLAESDIIVLATPIYFDGMNSQMKVVIDRYYDLLQPIFEIRGGHMQHSRRPKFKQGKIVLVSVRAALSQNRYTTQTPHTNQAHNKPSNH